MRGADRDRHRHWFGFQQAESGRRDHAGQGSAVVPIGALVTFGAERPVSLTPGLHGSTFGGNPLAAAAGLAVLTRSPDDLLAHARVVGIISPMPFAHWTIR